MPKHRYTIEFYPSNGNGLSVPLAKPDFQTAIDWCQFEALRAGHVPEGGMSLVEPVFANGGPRISEFRVTLPASGGPFSASLPYSYFSSTAGRYRAALVKSGELPEEDECHWAMSAWQSDEGTAAESPVTQLSLDIALDSLEGRLMNSNPNRPDDGSQFKVFIPKDVLDETAEMANSASPNECGGVLLGHLKRDPASGEIFEVITGFVPALSAVASELELRFTPEAWCAVRTAIKLRGGNEIWVGWEHSHTPVSWNEQCGRCPAEKQRTCPLATQLFSEQDRALHRLFPSFCIALVANVLADGVVHSCFGWNRGVIESRPFYMMEKTI
jgi:proteasome lid subunit RPN8/RPN11